MDRSLTDRAYALLLFAVVVSCYGCILAYPHIQDDWRMLYYLSSEPGPAHLCRDLLDPRGSLFFRPLSRLYHVASYHLFGLHSSGFHALALLWLWAGSWLVARVLREFTGDALAAQASGVLYAAATSIHMDSMLWEAGINELGGAFFVLLAALLYMKGRSRAAAAAWFVALLFKEAAIFLPAVLALVSMNRREPLLRRLAPFAVVAALYAIPKSMNLSAAALPDGHPYAVRIPFAHLPASLCSYLAWTVDALFPYVAEAEWNHAAFAALARHPLAVIALVLVLAAAVIALAPDAGGRRRNAILLAWAGCGLAPVLILPSHLYRYYLTYALPPLCLLFVLGVRGIFARWISNPRAVTALLVSVVAVNVAFSGRYLSRRHAEGLDQQFRDGTNHLVARGQTVNLVWSALKQLHPSLPRGSVLVFDGVEVLGFDLANGPSVWYGDPSLRVLTLDYVHQHRDGASVRTPDYAQFAHLGFAPGETVQLARGTTFVFRLEQRTLRDVTDDFFLSIGM